MMMYMYAGISNSVARRSEELVWSLCKQFNHYLTNGLLIQRNIRSRGDAVYTQVKFCIFSQANCNLQNSKPYLIQTVNS